MPLASQLTQRGLRGSNQRRRRVSPSGTVEGQQRAGLKQTGGVYQPGGGAAQTPGLTQGGGTLNNMGAQMGQTAPGAAPGGISPDLRQGLEARVSGEQRMAMGGAQGGQAPGTLGRGQADSQQARAMGGANTYDYGSPTNIPVIGHQQRGEGRAPGTPFGGGMGQNPGQMPMPGLPTKVPGPGAPNPTDRFNTGGPAGTSPGGGYGPQNGTPTPPGQGTDAMMEDAIRAALEDYMQGPDVEGITDRYNRDLSQSKIDSRARMGALGMSGSGASASLQAGLARQSADATQSAIDQEKQRLMGNAMAATGMGIGLDDMAVRRALLEQLYGPGAGDGVEDDPSSDPTGGNHGVGGGDAPVTGDAYRADDRANLGDHVTNTMDWISGQMPFSNETYLGSRDELPGDAIFMYARNGMEWYETPDGKQFVVPNTEYDNAPYDLIDDSTEVEKAEQIPGFNEGEAEKITYNQTTGLTVYRGSDGKYYSIKGSH